MTAHQMISRKPLESFKMHRIRRHSSCQFIKLSFYCEWKHVCIKLKLLTHARTGNVHLTFGIFKAIFNFKQTLKRTHNFSKFSFKYRLAVLPEFLMLWAQETLAISYSSVLGRILLIPKGVMVQCEPFGSFVLLRMLTNY